MTNIKETLKRQAVWIVVLSIALGYWLYNNRTEFTLGLDLAGGSAITYSIDTSKVSEGENVNDAVNALRDVVERRIDVFGVKEPTIVTSFSRLSNEHRLVVELPGVTNVDEAARIIGDTPVLEFKVLSPEGKFKYNSTTTTNGEKVSEADYIQSGLTGALLVKSRLMFDQRTNQPIVELNWNSEGRDLFAKITKENLNFPIAIFLDGTPISSPVVQTEITDGKAIISGQFKVEDAKTLVGRLNQGALPLPMTLSAKSVVDARLGGDAVQAGIKSAVVGFLMIVIFMIFIYRLPGIIASLALSMYVIIMLTLFKIVPVTLTASGLAGFIISIGLAVDANVLTFERMKEELRSGKGFQDAIRIGFDRAWTSIRDSHIAAILVSIILFWLGTSIVKGFAFTFFLGAVVSLISAQIFTRIFLLLSSPNAKTKVTKFLYGSGITNA